MKYLPVYVLSAALALFIFLFAAQQEETARAEVRKERATTELFSLITMNQVEQENSSLKNRITELELAARQVAEIPAQFTVVSAGKDLMPFESKAELQEWLEENYIVDALPGQCVDTALELCGLAWWDGYQMSTELQGDGEPEGHMICSTIIGDVIYFIDPAHTAIWVGGKKKG